MFATVMDGPRGSGYRHMIDASQAGRAGAPDEVGKGAALLMGPDCGFITGSDFLMMAVLRLPTGMVISPRSNKA